MRTFLVTGAAGFIGSNIAEALIRRGDRVRGLDDLSSGQLQNIEALQHDLEFFEGDINDAALVAKAMRGVDCVFHEAALASVPRSLEAPMESHAACAAGALNVLDQARLAGVRRVVYAASGSAYGDQPFSSKRETDFPAPLSPYAAFKLAAEFYCEAFNHCYGLETVALRYFNIYGPRQDPDSPYSSVIPLFITAMLAGKQPTIFGDGLQTRDFTFVGDVVQANLLAADAPQAPGHRINIGCGRAYSLLDLVAALNAALDVDIEPRHAPPREGDIRDSMADISRARQVLGYEPQVDLQEGLRRSIDYYRSLTAA